MPVSQIGCLAVYTASRLHGNRKPYVQPSMIRNAPDRHKKRAVSRSSVFPAQQENQCFQIFRKPYILTACCRLHLFSDCLDLLPDFLLCHAFTFLSFPGSLIENPWHVSSVLFRSPHGLRFLYAVSVSSSAASKTPLSSYSSRISEIACPR